MKKIIIALFLISLCGNVHARTASLAPNMSGSLSPSTAKSADNLTVTPTGGNIPVKLNNFAARQVSVSDYGAVQDGTYISDPVIASGGVDLTSASGASIWNPSDVGKSIIVVTYLQYDAGSGQVNISKRVVRSTIASYISPSHVTLTDPASSTCVSGQCRAYFGTDNTAAFNAAGAALNTLYLGNSTLLIPNTKLGTSSADKGYYFSLPIVFTNKAGSAPFTIKDDAPLFCGVWENQYCISTNTQFNVDGQIKMYVGGGSGIRFGTTAGNTSTFTIDSLNIRGVGTYTPAELGNTYGSVMVYFGAAYGHVDSIMGTGGNYTAVIAGTDIDIDSIHTSNSNHGLVYAGGFGGGNINNLTCDTLGSGGVCLDLSKGNVGTVKVHNLTTYSCSNNTSLQGAYVIKFGNYSYNNIDINAIVRPVGGTAVLMDGAQHDVKIVTSVSYAATGCSNGAVTKGVEYAGTFAPAKNVVVEQLLNTDGVTEVSSGSKGSSILTTYKNNTIIVDATKFSANGVSPFGTLISGNYYNSYLLGSSIGNGTATPTVDTLFAVPMLIPYKTTIDSLNIRTTSTSVGTGARVKACIYENDFVTNKPAGLLASATNAGVGFAAEGESLDVALTLNTPLEINPGFYWATTLHTTSTTGAIFRSQNSTVSSAYMGYSSVSNWSASTPNIAWTAAQSFSSDCPSVFPSATVYSINGLGIVPAVAFHVQ